ncbi:MAG: L,D-transpeptidase/peptidoglycan binding protein [Coriobacteriia bacterium]|nr:L,D-transpeptidase/peptidoglycan binding protein [Coriobacteriia bacterium]MBN2840671.1 L,D-transpeptidase/peptidoglycan binding protein [Coriobacteriia bacterium]
MHRASLPTRIVALVASVALFALTGGATIAVADDYLTREIFPRTTVVAGVDISGMTRDEARDAIAEEVVAPLGEPITVRHGAVTFTLDAASMLEVDVGAMVDAAFEPRKVAALPSRVVDRVADRAVGVKTGLQVTLDEDALEQWLHEAAASVETTPSDAVIALEDGAVVVVPSRTGITLDTTTTAEALRAALTNGEKVVDAAIIRTEPAVTESDLGPAILVDISERRLYLYERGSVSKTYGVAVGTPSHPTPRGEFEITLKRYMPTWSNPGSAWAAGMPQTIGPGPSNPLGTRALNIDSPGIRIHGTSADYSIGTAASHGCMRMHRWDIEDLYERVGVGTPVFIVR